MLRGRETVRADRRLCTDVLFIRAQSTILYKSHPEPPLLLSITVFSVRIKSASVQKTRLWIKARAVRGGFYTRSSIVHGCAFHPCAIDDPRGRFLVRATSQLCNKGDE